jgi:hypothetical protein
LGEKESVAYAALKLLRDGFPPNARDRRLVIAAVVQACVFEGSDRARALLYRVIELNRHSFTHEFGEASRSLEETFRSMADYRFPTDQLDLSRGRKRLHALSAVIGE